MALKIRFARSKARHPLALLLFRIAILTFGTVVLTLFGVSSYFYFKYGHIVDERLKQPIFANTAQIYAAPREVRPGQKLSVSLLANELRNAGYSLDGASPSSPLGTYSAGGGAITVHPGPESYHAQDGATIHISAGVVDSIADDHRQPLSSYELEPLLITGLSDDPTAPSAASSPTTKFPNLVQAVLAIEDRRFFEHSGVNYFSMISWDGTTSSATASIAAARPRSPCSWQSCSFFQTAAQSNTS
jgi:penicillin-binding protein 1B